MLDKTQQQILGLTEDTTVIAGAGAGKTTSLVYSIFNDIHNNQIDPKKMAVITFTKAAANNITRKLEERLKNEGVSDHETSNILRKIEIGTIDSLVAHRLSRLETNQKYREHFPEPLAQVSGDIRQKLLAISSLEEILTSTNNPYPNRIDLDFLSKRFLQVREAKINRTSDLIFQADSLEKIKTILDNQKDLEFPKTLEIKDSLVSAPEYQAKIAGQAHLDADRQLTALEHLKQAYHLTFENQLEADFALNCLHEKIIECIFAQPKINQKAYRKNINFPYGNGLLPLTNLPRDPKPELVYMILAFNRYLNCQQTDQFAKKFTECYKLWEQVYLRKMNQEQVCSYADLTQRLAAAIEIVGVPFEKTYLDEAQDTSPIQFELVRRLTAPGGLVLIGDPNQSIYSFRNADVRSYQDFSENLNQITLNNNYRSSNAILSFVHKTFQERTSQSRLDGIIEFPKMNAAGDQSEIDDCPVKFKGVFYHDSRMSASKWEQMLTATEINDLIQQGYKFSDIAVLVRSNKDISEYEKTLTEAGIPVIAYSDKLLLGSDEARDIIAYLKLVVNPNDQKALVRILSSPFVNLPVEVISNILADINQYKNENEITSFQALKKTLKDYPQAEILEDFTDQIDRSTAILEQNSAQEMIIEALNHGYNQLIKTSANPENSLLRISKIENYIAEIEKVTGKNYYQLIQVLNYDEVLEPAAAEGIDAEAVKIMTVHKAKGDEFKVVILGNLYGGSKPDPIKIIDNPKASKQLKVSNPFLLAGEKINGQFETKDFSFNSLINQQSKQNYDNEYRRLLYVAMTRAEKKLVITTSFTKASTESVNLIENIVGIKESTMEELFSGVELVNGHPTKQEIVLKSGDKCVVNYEYLSTEAAEHNYNQILNVSNKDFDSQNPENETSINQALALPLISHSNLQSWKHCSLRKQLEYDYGLRPYQKDPDDNTLEFKDDQTVISNGARAFGEKIHLRLSQLNSWARKNQQSFSQAISQAIKDETDLKMRNYLQSILSDSELAEILGKPGEAEERLLFKIGEHRIVAILDWLTGQDKIILIDWKTGDWENISQVDDQLKLQHQEQRKLYSYGILLDTKVNHVEARTYYVSETSISYQQDRFSETDKAALGTELLKEINHIVNQPTVKPSIQQEQFYCGGCPGLQRTCPLSDKTS